VTGNGQTVVTVLTTAPHVTQLFDQHPYYLARVLTGSGFALGGVFILGSSRRRRYSLPLLLITFSFMMMIPGCGGGSSSHHQQDPGTAPGTYIVNVSATGGGLTQTSQVQVVVQ
jgi:hypothetical protein